MRKEWPVCFRAFSLLLHLVTAHYVIHPSPISHTTDLSLSLLDCERS